MKENPGGVSASPASPAPKKPCEKTLGFGAKEPHLTAGHRGTEQKSLREDASRTDLGAMAHDGTSAARARGTGGTGGVGLGWVVEEGVEILSNHFLVAVWSHPGVQNQFKVVRGSDSQLPLPRVGRFTSKLYTCCLT